MKAFGTAGNKIFYGWMVPYNKSIEVIKQYFMLLFPINHFGEGFLGTFIGTYSADLPIIASDWNYNAELIQEGITGMYAVQTVTWIVLMNWYGSPYYILKRSLV